MCGGSSFQEVQEVIPGVGHRRPWDDTGSGESSGECDDEDGCEGSGVSVESPCEFTHKATLSALRWFDEAVIT